ncbi:unnamed protein product [Fraxinus pennsylvanica]|uniref:Uncharacterized protein n=1 Tax=Fraxinus pennsylvanica TaxID=56036 RepID=A0AAD2E3I6_9LAMI|nr:unnamed protein product [Fraxinus pennsylvanica]
MASGSIDSLVHQSSTLEKPMSDSPKTLFDLPPDSFWVPKDYEQDWFDRNAMMQRKTSIKLAGSTQNSKSFSHRSSISFNQKHRKSLIGLAGSTQTPRLGFTGDANQRLNQVGNPSLFRSWSEPGGKPPMQLSEPGSPRVSCTGRIGFKNGGHRTTGFLRLFNSIFRPGRSVKGEIAGGFERKIGPTGKVEPKRSV